MSEEHERTQWNDNELQLGVLQVLYYARGSKKQGTSGLVLMDSLNAQLIQLEQTLHSLRSSDLIEVGDRVFLITSRGIAYLADQLGPGGLSPDEPSRVPPRPLPTTGAGAISLPLPDQSNESETR
jgi:hypothetical protein